MKGGREGGVRKGEGWRYGRGLGGKWKGGGVWGGRRERGGGVRRESVREKGARSGERMYRRDCDLTRIRSGEDWKGGARSGLDEGNSSAWV